MRGSWKMRTIFRKIKLIKHSKMTLKIMFSNHPQMEFFIFRDLMRAEMKDENDSDMFGEVFTSRNSMRNYLKDHYHSGKKPQHSNLNLDTFLWNNGERKTPKIEASTHTQLLHRFYWASLRTLLSWTFQTILKKFQNSFVRKLKNLNAKLIENFLLNDFVMSVDCFVALIV